MNTDRLYTILLHIAGWLVFFSLPFIFMVSQFTTNRNFSYAGLFAALIGFTVYILIFYLHTYFLFPKLYFKKRKWLYFLSMVALLLSIYFLQPYDRLTRINRSLAGDTIGRRTLPPGGMDRLQRDRDPGNIPFPGEQAGPPETMRRMPPPGPMAINGRRSPHIDIISLELFIVVIAISIALILEKRWRVAIQETARAEADKANAELSFLKAQINPHFLFNTLNNIYSLAVTKNENVADAIMKLSNIMRYVTDEVNEDFVSLEKELDSISDYVSLQRLRLGKKASIDFTVEGDTGGKMIAPLILMPFVENAFKHGISTALTSTIVVKVKVAEKTIDFYTENKLFATPRNVERTGIGNTNTKKRLAQIYPEKYILETGAQNGLFTVHLLMYI